jgi:hypothetical protein
LFQHASGDTDAGVDAGADCGSILSRRYECPWARIASHPNCGEDAKSSAHADGDALCHANDPANNHPDAAPRANGHPYGCAHAAPYTDTDGPAETFAHRHARLARMGVTTIAPRFSAWQRLACGSGLLPQKRVLLCAARGASSWYAKCVL